MTRGYGTAWREGVTVTHGQSFAVLCAGALALTVGLTWALGPWALAGCGVLLVVAALLLPDRTAPTEEQLAEAVRRAVEGQ